MSEEPKKDDGVEIPDPEGISDYSNTNEGSVESAVPSSNEEDPTGEEASKFRIIMFTEPLPKIDNLEQEFDSEDANNFIAAINECINYYCDYVKSNIVKASGFFENFNQKTKEKLEAKNITWSTLFEEKSGGKFPTYCRQLLEHLDGIVSMLKQNINDMFAIEDGETHTPEDPGNTPLGGASSSGGVISGSVIDTTIDTSPIIASVTFGSIVLTTATTLYETIGGVGISANLTGNYSVIGITKENDKYYYKVIDNATKKVYYMEMTDDVKFQTEYKNLLHVKENAMMLSSMEIGSDNFVKLADPNTIYFIQNETENNGITFYNVIDANDGKSYYIPGSDSVENIPLDSIASIVDTPTTETTTVTGEGV